jgi:hypothetical protein
VFLQPISVEAIYNTVAITPPPQVNTIGFSVSMFAAAKASLTWAGVLSLPSPLSSDGIGKLMEPGMLPELNASAGLPSTI